MKAKELVVFVDERGTGLELGFFTVAGIAIYGSERVAVVREGWENWRKGRRLEKKKSQDWNDCDLCAFADFLISEKVFPIATSFPVTKENKKAIENIVPQLYPTEISDLVKSRKLKIRAGTWLWGTCLEDLLLGVVTTLSWVTGPISKITIVSDRSDIQKKPIILNHFNTKLQKLNGPLLLGGLSQSMAKRKTERAKCQLRKFRKLLAWSNGPSLSFIPTEPLVELADAYCTLVGRSQTYSPSKTGPENLRREPNPVAVAGMKRIVRVHSQMRQLSEPDYLNYHHKDALEHIRQLRDRLFRSLGL